MPKYRVAFLGKNTVAVNALEILSKKNCEIVLVSPNNSDSGEDGWQLSLMKRARELNYNIKKFEKIKEHSSIEYLSGLELDFIFSIQYDQIINQKVIDTAKHGAINLHFAQLPRYRGVSPIGLSLLNGEKEFGTTLHYMDPGVDTGDIIAQRTFNIEKVKDARELYNIVVEQSILLFNDEIDKILTLSNSRTPQDNSKALYYPNGSVDFKKNTISFNKDTNNLYNWIRAFIFPPFQYPVFTYQDNTYEVIAATPDFRKNKFEKPGTLVKQEGKNFKFATHDAYIDVITK